MKNPISENYYIYRREQMRKRGLYLQEQDVINFVSQNIDKNDKEEIAELEKFIVANNIFDKKDDEVNSEEPPKQVLKELPGQSIQGQCQEEFSGQFESNLGKRKSSEEIKEVGRDNDDASSIDNLQRSPSNKNHLGSSVKMRITAAKNLSGEKISNFKA